MLTVALRIYQILVMCPLIIVATIITAVVTVIGSAVGLGRWAGYYPEILWARLFCVLNFVKVSVRREGVVDTDTSYVFVANHQSAYDIFTVYGYLGHNFRWMMKAGLRRIPFVGWACGWSKQIFVDNSTPSATRRTMTDAEAVLGAGMSLVIFPEGARTWDGKMRPFKRGAFKLAREFDLPIVPLTIQGAFDVLPRWRYLPNPGRITLTVHPPVQFADFDGDLGKTAEGVHAIIESGMAESK